MTTTDTPTLAPAVPAQRAACGVCNKAHKPGSAPELACQRKAAAATAAAESAELDVTTDDVLAVLTGMGLVITMQGAGDTLSALVLPAFCARSEILADRDDVRGLLAAYRGNVKAVAVDLSMAVRWERQSAGGAA